MGTVKPEYFVCTRFPYAWPPDHWYAWNVRTAADRSGFSFYFRTKAATYEIYKNKNGWCSAPGVPGLPDLPGKQARHKMAETLFCGDELGQVANAVRSLSCRRPALARHAAKNFGPWTARWGGHLCPPALTSTLLSLSRSYLSVLCLSLLSLSFFLSFFLSLSLSLSLISPSFLSLTLTKFISLSLCIPCFSFNLALLSSSFSSFILRQDPPPWFEFLVIFYFLHHGIEEVERHLLWKFH